MTSAQVLPPCLERGCRRSWGLDCTHSLEPEVPFALVGDTEGRWRWVLESSLWKPVGGGPAIRGLEQIP